MSGVPRSGSTVLATLLSKHPDLSTSATSPMWNLLSYARNYGYNETPYFPRNCERVLNIQRSIMDGFYQHVDEPFILDKERDWASQCSLLEILLGEKPKFVATTRRISEIISSFVIIANKSKGKNAIDREVIKAAGTINCWTRPRVIWQQFICPEWKKFKAGYESHPECFLLADYADITDNPKEVVNSIYKHFEMDTVDKVSMANLVNPTPEDDAVFGIPGLHDVRPTLKRASPPPEEILGEEVCAYWDEKKLEFWVK